MQCNVTFARGARCQQKATRNGLCNTHRAEAASMTDKQLKSVVAIDEMGARMLRIDPLGQWASCVAEVKSVLLDRS